MTPDTPPTPQEIIELVRARWGNMTAWRRGAMSREKGLPYECPYPDGSNCAHKFRAGYEWTPPTKKEL